MNKRRKDSQAGARRAPGPSTQQPLKQSHRVNDSNDSLPLCQVGAFQGQEPLAPACQAAGLGKPRLSAWNARLIDV